MIIQLGNKDNAKDIIEVENINMKGEDISPDIELLRSQFLFEKAIQLINYNVSFYAKGQFLTEEKYNSSRFNVLPFELKDSSLIGIPIVVKYSKGSLNLLYSLNGQKYKLTSQLNKRIKNQHFDLTINSSNPRLFEEESKQNELYFTLNSVASVSARFLPYLQVVPIDPIAKTIQISLKSNNPQLCFDIASAVSTAYNKYDEEIKRKGSENILAFIDQQLDSLSGELKNSKDSLMQYQRRSNLPDPEGISTQLSSNISKLQDQLFEVQDEVRSLNSVYSKLKSDPNRLDVYRILPEMLGKSYETSLNGQLTSLYELLEKKENLLYRVTEDNSEVKALGTKINLKLSSVRRSVATILERLIANSNVISKKIQSFEGEYFQLPEKKMEFSRLKNIQDLNEKYFTLLTEKKVLYSISNAGYSSENRVLTRATVNSTPVAPNKKLIYGSFIFFGFILGLGVILFKYLTFNEINMIDDLKKLLPTEASILGGVPLSKSPMEFSQLVVSESPKSMLAEAMRKIRTNLSYINPNYKTIAITSSISGEGKTFVALNLAGIIAMSGKKTILLDLDMRKPKVHLGLNADNVYGMSGLIINQFSLEQCIQHSLLENLDFITAGPIPPNPSELLLSGRFKEIVEKLKETYDTIIIDNPPIGLVSDGIKILTDADIPIYVFKSHYSKRNFAFRVKELFEMKQLDRLNVVL
ncbi:MAG: hypothetical protein RIT10_1587, partial [Bacteroidota bacterium]